MIKKTIWLSSLTGSFGIVGIDNGQKRKLYLGNCLGFDEATDAKHIKDNGAPLGLEQLKELVGFLAGEIQVRSDKEIVATSQDIVRVYSDGATKGVNGKLGTVSEVGLGVWIKDRGIEIAKPAPGISNNEAEFKALILAMERCIEEGVQKAVFYLDSKIVVNRANGARPTKAKFKNERMDSFQDRVFQLKEKFEYTAFKWIPRERNGKADALSKKALYPSK